MKKYKSGMFCFSPPVMLATLLLETALAAYILWRYRWNNLVRIAVVMLLLLATFQLAEFMICEVDGVGPLTWARIGYVAITLLPPLGAHLAYEIAGSKRRPLLLPAYALAALFALFFIFVGQAIQAQACLGNYVIFNMAPGMGWLYAVYYYGFVVGSIALSVKLAKGLNKARRTALTALALGYGAFLLPTTTINLVDQSTLAGIPSIMCGFAVLLAVVIGIWIMPAVGEKR